MSGTPVLSAVVTCLWMSVALMHAAQAQLAPPTQERDLVAFIAKEQPPLYRLVGRKPVPSTPASTATGRVRPC